MTVHIKTTRRSSMMAALGACFDEGSGAAKLRIYTGSQPANADTAASGTLLLEFTLQDPAWTESGGVLTLDVTPAITDDALADGTAGWGRFLDSDDEAVVDGAVGSEITLSDTSLETGQTVTVVSATLTLPA
jgi:hypothetical protein